MGYLVWAIKGKNKEAINISYGKVAAYIILVGISQLFLTLCTESHTLYSFYHKYVLFDEMGISGKEMRMNGKVLENIPFILKILPLILFFKIWPVFMLYFAKKQYAKEEISIKMNLRKLGNIVVAFVAPVAAGSCRVYFYEEKEPHGLQEFDN